MQNIELRKLAGKGRVEFVNNPNKTVISMTVKNLVLWFISVACLYSIAWLILNIFRKNWSTGARILDWIIRKIFGDDKGFIPEEERR